MSNVLNTLQQRRLRYYLRLDYPVHVVQQGSYFLAFVTDLPGCEFRGADLPELYARIDEGRRLWIARAILENRRVPAPYSAQEADNTENLKSLDREPSYA